MITVAFVYLVILIRNMHRNGTEDEVVGKSSAAGAAFLLCILVGLSAPVSVKADTSTEIPDYNDYVKTVTAVTTVCPAVKPTISRRPMTEFSGSEHMPVCIVTTAGNSAG